MAEAKHVMHVMSHEGDTRTTWAVKDRESVDQARAIFDKLMAEGYTAFQMDGATATTGEQVKSFNEEAVRIIFVPQVVGG